jgi:hypothetical protein
VLTLDNEEAEIKVGDNIPIITSRVQSAAGVDTTEGLATSQNIERQDVGITLRVTPQISEGDQLRLKIFQEVTAVNSGLTGVTGDPEEVGVALSNRKIENTVVVSDDETIVIGGLIDEAHNDKETKVPFLGDIPVLGWLFKTTSTDSTKRNLLVFLTPHIMRSDAEMALETMRKREEFSTTSRNGLKLTDADRRKAQQSGVDVASLQDPNPVRARLKEHRKRYPLERMRELEEEAEKAPKRSQLDEAGERFGVLAATYGDEGAAAATLQELIAAGYDGSLVTEDRSGTLLYEVRLGPFATREEAEDAMAHASASLGLSPTLTLEPPAEGE